jgi:hypothetical protein
VTNAENEPERWGVVRRLSEYRSRTVTGRELVLRGSCTADCLLADPKSECICRCNGKWHGGVSHYKARPHPGW